MDSPVPVDDRIIILDIEHHLKKKNIPERAAGLYLIRENFLTLCSIEHGITGHNENLNNLKYLPMETTDKIVNIHSEGHGVAFGRRTGNRGGRREQCFKVLWSQMCSFVSLAR